MEKCLKNKVAIEVFNEICDEDLRGAAPKEDPPEEKEEKRLRHAGLRHRPLRGISTK